MFGGLFVGYVIYHAEYPEIFKAGSHFLDWKKGAINTVVLLVSSFTMAMSIYYAQKDKIKHCQQMLIATLVCGFLFMFIKYIEYSHKFHEGIYPGGFFSYTGEGFVEGLPLYFSFYYLMTGLHASHVLIGLALISWMLLKTYRKQIGPHHYAPLEYVGLFWHLVDLNMDIPLSSAVFGGMSFQGRKYFLWFFDGWCKSSFFPKTLYLFFAINL